MGRQIKTAGEVHISETTPNIDDFKDRLVKLIPSEIITAYITVQGLIKGNAGNGGNPKTLLWIVFLLLLVLTPIYLIKITGVEKTGQVVFTTIAFILWVLVIGGPIDHILGYDASFIGSIALVIYTLFVPFVYKG